MYQRFSELDERLNDLWQRRDQLTPAEGEELYRLVHRILGEQRVAEYASLPGCSPEELVTDFFADKVYLPATRSAYQVSSVHSGALCVYYRRYLRDRIRGGADGGAAPGRPASSGSEHDAETAAAEDIPDSPREPDLPELLQEQGLSLEQVAQAALNLLNAQGRWQPLQPDGWWIRLYLGLHYCPDKEVAMPLSALAREYDIPAYHYKARQLGITWPRGGFQGLEAFAGTVLGQWIGSLGIPLQPEQTALLYGVLRILCCTALSLQEAPERPG